MKPRASGGTSTGEGREDGAPIVEGPYRIATVAELTGVPEPTLRAWERRYGIPTPERTASGYRLYGAQQVRQVLEMRRLSDEGMAAAEAAKLLLSRDLAEEAAGEGGATDSAGDSFQATIDAILAAVERFDDDALEEQLRRVMFLGAAGEIFDRVLAPALVAIGDRWHSGELSVAQEHFATQKVSAVVRDLVRLSSGAQAAERAIFASFADEEHELGVLGFALRVSEWGARPIFLGARTPPSAVRSAVEALSPRFVGLSVSVTPSPPRARELIEDYAAACGSVPWLVGGAGARALAELVARSGGLLAPDDPAALHALVQPLLTVRAARHPRSSR